MDSNKDDIFKPEIKNIFETLFRNNILSVILLVILANGYSNIPGMNELLTDIFSSHILRTLITFVLFFQIIDNIKESIFWTIIICSLLYLIEHNHLQKKKIKSTYI
jgi:hypothetical protein